MRYSVSLRAYGDRVIELSEVVEFADAVATYSGIASGVGSMSYGAQLIVDAQSSDEAVESAVKIFDKAVQNSTLPVWPIAEIEFIAEDEDFDELE